MAERRQNVIVGMFALLGIVVLGVLILAFGAGRKLFADTYDVSVHFPKGVLGVQEGQRVTLNGKRIGDTKEVQFWDPKDVSKGVRVIVAVDSEYALPAKSDVNVAASIMGFGRPIIEWVVSDTTDTAPLPRDGTGMVQGRMVQVLDQVLKPEIQAQLTQATKNIGDFAHALTPVAEQLNRLLQPHDLKDVDVGKLVANLDTVVQRFDATLKNLNALIGDPKNQENVGTILANFRKMSESGVVLADDLKSMSGDGKQVVKDVAELARRMIVATDEMTSVLKRMDQTLAALNEGKGTAGLMLKDNRLYEELLLSVQRMTKMMDDFREVLDQAKKGELKFRAF